MHFSDIRRHLTGLLKMLGAATLYISLYIICRNYFSFEGGACLFFVASGQALATLIIGGRVYAWSILLGALLANLLTGDVVWVAASKGAGSTLGALLGAVLLTRGGGFCPSLQSLRDYLRLIVCGGFGAGVSALAGATAMLGSGVLTAETYSRNLANWWMGDALGVVVTAPLMLLWWNRRKTLSSLRKIVDLRRAAETILTIGLTFLAGQVIFLGWFYPSQSYVAKGYVMLIFITWIAVRLETQWLAAALAMVAIQATLGTLLGSGYFADDLLESNLTNCWLYVMTLSISGMVMGTYIAEYKRTIVALDDEDRHLRALFDATPDAILVSDGAGIITRANQQAGNLLGYAIEELIGRSIEILIPDSSRAVHPRLRGQYTAAPFVRQMGEGRAVRARRKDGTEIDVEISLSPIRTGQGLHFASAMRDVTKRKQEEAALQASESRFRRMANSSPMMIWITDAEGVPSFVNQSWIDFTGIDQALAMTSEGWLGTVHPDDRETSFVAYYRNECSRDYITTEYRLRRADGEWRHVLDKGTPLFDDDGAFSGYIGSAIDITERKQAEAKLRVAAIAFESQEAMVITDAETVILQINQAFTQITGYTALEVVGRRMDVLKSGHHDQAFYEAMWECIGRTETWQGEIWDKRKNGEIYPTWLTITAVKDDHGAIVNYVGTHIDITARKLAENEIRHLAFYDSLTHLPNRRLLLDRLKQALASSARSHQRGALLFIDLDNFKLLNDTLGHDRGDLLLQQVAERLITCVRESDTVARQGGDEFVMMLEDLTEDSEEAAARAEHVARKIIAVLDQPYQLVGQEYHITPSIGVTLFQGPHGSMDELLKQADIAMYQAKTAGRNTLRFFDPAMQATVVSRALMEADLRHALVENRLRLYFQTQVLHDGRILGAEVLLRWEHPLRGLVSPLDFIGLAEETGLICPIGQWVLETACAQLVKWEGSADTSQLHLAVNVSARQFRQPDFVEQVRQALSTSKLAPERLKLELTESVVLDSIDEAVSKMRSLKEMGVRFSMDDFGTGYSSLAYLTKLPLDQLKIDQSFVRNIGVNHSDSAIVQTIVGMAGNLGIEVIAEGVETEAQRAFLEQHGCMICQGYLFSKPVPLEAFEQLLRPAAIESVGVN